MTQRSCHFQRIIKLSYKPRRHMRRPVSGQSGQKNRSTISSAPANGIRQRPIFPTRLQVSIVGSAQLNFCVRNGNRWTLRVNDTDFFFVFLLCCPGSRIFPLPVYIPRLRRKISGAPSGTRTLDPLIKSQLLYQLS